MLIVAIAVAAGCLAQSTARESSSRDASAQTIRVIDHGWHTAIVVRRSAVDTTVWPEVDDFPDAAFVEVAWGDRDFYMADRGTAWAGGQGGVPHIGKRAPRRRLRRAARDGLPWKRRRRARGFTPRVRRDDTLFSRGIPAGRAGPARASGAWAIRCELVLRRAKPLPPVQHVQHVGGARPSRRRPRRHARRHGDRRRRHARSAACGDLPQAVDPQGEGITAVESVGRSSPAGPTDHRSRAHGVARGDRRGPRDDECRAGGAASGR